PLARLAGVRPGAGPGQPARPSQRGRRADRSVLRATQPVAQPARGPGPDGPPDPGGDRHTAPAPGPRNAGWPTSGAAAGSSGIGGSSPATNNGEPDRERSERRDVDHDRFL